METTDYDDEKINYKLQRRLYHRNDSRTATVLRKKPDIYGQVLMSTQNRWRQQPMDDQTNVQPVQDGFAYGTNFNTNFNTQFDSPLSNERDISPSIEHPSEKNIEEKSYAKPIPRRTGRNLPYRVLYRIRPSMHHRQKMRNVIDVDYMPPSNLIRLFGESSVPGVRDIALSQSFLRRIFWICSFFFFGFLALRDISQLVSEYYTYPITVDVRLRDSRRLQFPAVTVCNMNIVRYSALCITNVSVIKESMIPRDLREKLCGMQATTTNTPTFTGTTSNMTTTTSTTPKPTGSTIFETKGTGSTSAKTKPQIQKTTPMAKKKIATTSTTGRLKTTTIATTAAASNDVNEGIDDINNYGVLSNYTDVGANETIPTENVTQTTTTTEATTITTTVKQIDDLPGDIAAPIVELDIKLDRPKRRIKTPSNKMNSSENIDKNSTANNLQSMIDNPGQKSSKNQDKDNQSKEPPPFSDNSEIELTEREEKELQENLTNWLAVISNSNEKITKQLGHQFEDFVLRCTIRSTNCTHANSFEHFFTPTEGNCFTFKSQNLRKTYLERIKDETSIAGVNYGLEVVLNLEISEYLTGTAQIGAIIMIQHPDEIGNSASEAIFVAPQQSTYIGLKMVNISRLPKPYPEECIDHWPPALVGRLTQNASYSQQACLKICLQRTIHTRCQCQSAQLPQLELNSTLKICDTRRKITRNCVEEVMFQAEEKVSTCKCPPRCQVINYDKTVSMTKWPTREDKVTIDTGKTNINFQNLAKVTVYFQTMTCQEVRQEKAYTTAKLFSSLGGILGMYVGFSFLSLFEILEIFARRFWYIVTKKNIRFRAAVHAITATFAMKPKKPRSKVNNFNNNNSKSLKGNNLNAELTKRKHSRAIELDSQI